MQFDTFPDIQKTVFKCGRKGCKGDIDGFTVTRCTADITTRDYCTGKEADVSVLGV